MSVHGLGGPMESKCSAVVSRGEGPCCAVQSDFSEKMLLACPLPPKSPEPFGSPRLLRVSDNDLGHLSGFDYSNGHTYNH